MSSIFNERSALKNRSGLIDSSNPLPVAIQDQHTEIIDLKLGQPIQPITLVSDVVFDNTVITVSAASEPGLNEIGMKQGTHFCQAEILSVTPNGDNWDLELDTPFDFEFAVGQCSCNERLTNFTVDGSVTPQIFRVSPAGLIPETSWDITRFIVSFAGEEVTAQDPQPDDSDFGVMPALTKGIVIRVKNRTTKNVFNAKTNEDLRLRCYDLEYRDISKSGLYTVSARRSFSGQEKNGVVVRLDADTNDEFQVIIQDDLTHMTNAQMVIQGHVVEK